MKGSYRPIDQGETVCLEAGPNGTQVWWRGRRLLGPSPRDSQRRRLPAQPAEQTLYVCISPLLGEGIEPFARQLPRNSAIMGVEFEPLLADVWLRRERELATTPLATAFEEVRRIAQRLISRRALRRVAMVTLSGGGSSYRDRYSSLEAEIQDEIHRFWANRGTEIRLGRRWVANIWRNTVHRSGDFHVLRDAMPSKAVLIGAGPSLDTDIKLLEDELHRAAAENASNFSHAPTEAISRPAIVAIDTALPALAARRIPVDCVFAMDAQLANAADMVPWGWHNSVLIADMSAHPSIVRTFAPTRRILFSTRFSDLEILSSAGSAAADDMYALTTGVPSILPRGSVAPSALEILVRILGVTDLIVMGIDFWYRPPQTHARMATAHRRFLNLHDRTFGTGGAAQLVHRPWRSGTLRDGESVQLDAILADQASQLAHVVADLRTDMPNFQFRQLPNRGLSICADQITSQEVSRWFTVPPWRLPATLETELSQQWRYRRIQALTEVQRRLIAQETALKVDGPVYLDAILDCAWFDLPQWPLAGRTAAAARLHRFRFLRAVSDHRRRVGRALASAGVTPPGFP